MILALAFVTVFGLVVAFLLTTVDTAFRATNAVREQGADAYRVDGAVEVAIEKLRLGVDQTCAASGSALLLDGVEIECEQADPFWSEDFDTTYSYIPQHALLILGTGSSALEFDLRPCVDTSITGDVAVNGGIVIGGADPRGGTCTATGSDEPREPEGPEGPEEPQEPREPEEPREPREPQEPQEPQDPEDPGCPEARGPSADPRPSGGPGSPADEGEPDTCEPDATDGGAPGGPNDPGAAAKPGRMTIEGDLTASVCDPADAKDPESRLFVEGVAECNRVDVHETPRFTHGVSPTGAGTLSQTGGTCVFQPGTYSRAPSVPASCIGDVKFAPGDYLFTYSGSWNLPNNKTLVAGDFTSVGGRWKCDPDGAGVRFVFGPDANVTLGGNGTRFRICGGPLTGENADHLAIYSGSTSTFLSTNGAGFELTVDGLLFAPNAALNLQAVHQPRSDDNIIALLRGVVARTMRVDAPASLAVHELDETLLEISLPDTLAPMPRWVVLTARETADPDRVRLRSVIRFDDQRVDGDVVPGIAKVLAWNMMR